MASIESRVEKLEKRVANNGNGGLLFLTDGIGDFQSWVVAVQKGKPTAADPTRLTFGQAIMIDAGLRHLIKRKTISEKFGSNKPIDCARFETYPFNTPIFREAVRSAIGKEIIEPNISVNELQKIADAFTAIWKRYS